MGGSNIKRDYTTNYRSMNRSAGISYFGEERGGIKGMGVSINHYNTRKMMYYGNHNNNQRTGLGRMMFDNKHSSEGYFVDGKLGGFGHIVINGGIDGKYEGFMNAGSYQGQGLFKYNKDAGGGFYQGHLHAGQRNGFGVLLGGCNSFLYLGDFQTNTFHGQGYYAKLLPEYLFEYTGEFRGGQMVGKGIIKRTFYAHLPHVVTEEYGYYEETLGDTPLPQPLLFEGEDGKVLTHYSKTTVANEHPKYFSIRQKEAPEEEEMAVDAYPYYPAPLQLHEVPIADKYIKDNFLGMKVEISNYIRRQIGYKMEEEFRDIDGRVILEGPVYSANGQNILYTVQGMRAGRRIQYFVKCRLASNPQEVYLASYERGIYELLTESLINKNHDTNLLNTKIEQYFPELATCTGDSRHVVYDYNTELRPPPASRLPNQYYKHEVLNLEHGYERLFRDKINSYATFYEYIPQAGFFNNLMRNEYFDIYTLAHIFSKTLEIFKNLEKQGVYHGRVDESHISVEGLGETENINIKLVGFSHAHYFQTCPKQKIQILKDKYTELRSGGLEKNFRRYRHSMQENPNTRSSKPLNWDEEFVRNHEENIKQRHKYIISTKKPIYIWEYPKRERSVYLRPEEKWAIYHELPEKLVETWTSIADRDIYSLAVVFMKAFCIQGNYIMREKTDLHYDLLELFNNINSVHVPQAIHPVDSNPESVWEVYISKLSELREGFINVFLKENTNQDLYFFYVGHLVRVFEMLIGKYSTFNEIPTPNMETMLCDIHIGEIGEPADGQSPITQPNKMEYDKMLSLQIERVDEAKYLNNIALISAEFLRENYEFLNIMRREKLGHGVRKVKKYENGSSLDIICRYSSFTGYRDNIINLFNTCLPFDIRFVDRESEEGEEGENVTPDMSIIVIPGDDERMGMEIMPTTNQLVEEEKGERSDRSGGSSPRNTDRKLLPEVYSLSGRLEEDQLRPKPFFSTKQQIGAHPSKEQELEGVEDVGDISGRTDHANEEERSKMLLMPESLPQNDSDLKLKGKGTLLTDQTD